MRVTQDEWLIRLIGHDPTIDGSADDDHRIVELSRDVAFHLVAKGIDIILDEDFWAKAERASMRRRSMWSTEMTSAHTVCPDADVPTR